MDKTKEVTMDKTKEVTMDKTKENNNKLPTVEFNCKLYEITGEDEKVRVILHDQEKGWFNIGQVWIANNKDEFIQEVANRYNRHEEIENSNDKLKTAINIVKPYYFDGDTYIPDNDNSVFIGTRECIAEMEYIKEDIELYSRLCSKENNPHYNKDIQTYKKMLTDLFDSVKDNLKEIPLTKQQEKDREMKNSEKKELHQQVKLIGNIDHKNIKIDNEKGVARYSIAVATVKDKDGNYQHEWFNCVSFKKDDSKLFETLDSLSKGDKGVQVEARGFITHSSYEKDGETKHSTNFNMYSVAPTKEHLKPTASLQLNGEVFKPIEEHSKTITTPDGKEAKKDFATITMVTTGGKNKDGKDIKNYHSMITSNKEHIESLKLLKKGSELQATNIMLKGNGSLSLTVNSNLHSKELPEKTVPTKEEVSRDR